MSDEAAIPQRELVIRFEPYHGQDQWVIYVNGQKLASNGYLTVHAAMRSLRPIGYQNIMAWKNGGSAYRTRDGRRAIVLEPNVIVGSGQPIWQGRVEGEWTEWDDDGACLSGEFALDLVHVWKEQDRPRE